MPFRYGKYRGSYRDIVFVCRWSETEYGTGGKSVNVSAPLDEIPVFYLGSKENIFSGNV